MRGRRRRKGQELDKKEVETDKWVGKGGRISIVMLWPWLYFVSM